jgi:hypothetical protein
MTTTVTSTIRNGVDTATMYATLDAIKAQPEIANFQFRARNTWLGGAHNRTSIKDFYAAGGEDTSRSEAFIVDAGEPPILLGHTRARNPVECYLHALAACVTTSHRRHGGANGDDPSSRPCGHGPEPEARDHDQRSRSSTRTNRGGALDGSLAWSNYGCPVNRAPGRRTAAARRPRPARP